MHLLKLRSSSGFPISQTILLPFGLLRNWSVDCGKWRRADFVTSQAATVKAQHNYSYLIYFSRTKNQEEVLPEHRPLPLRN